MVREMAPNPYGGPLAVKHSCYARPVDGRLVRPGEAETPPLASRVHDALRAVVLDPEFPCVGARSAINQGSYRFGMYQSLADEQTTPGLARDLYAFVQEQPSIDGQYTSFIASFDAPKMAEPPVFEHLLWQQLALLHRLDGAPWDGSVSRDPSSPTFSFSFAGLAFFIVGLGPSGERWARRFPWPTLVFNPHAQFEVLRAEGHFERMQDVVRERDRQLEGSINPNLSNFGEHTEARQYSGRAVGPDWRCPVTFEEHRP